MAIDFSLQPAHTAVLSMDMQAGIVAIYAGDQTAFTERAAEVLGRARERGMTIIHVQVGFRPGLPEVGPRNRLFASIKSSVERQRLFQGEAGKIHPAVAPVGEDIVIVTPRSKTEQTCGSGVSPPANPPVRPSSLPSALSFFAALL